MAHFSAVTWRTSQLNFTGNTHSEPDTQSAPYDKHSTNHHQTVGRHSDEDNSITIPDLGGLFSVGPAFDAEEEAFYRAMQRRKKKNRRGPKL